jgi:hypothetical protein
MIEETNFCWKYAILEESIDEITSEPIISLNLLEKNADIEQYKSDEQLISAFNSSLDLVKYVELNRNTFLEKIIDYGSKFLDKQTLSAQEMDDAMLKYNSLFQNFLCSFRSFVDHSETSLSKLYGQDSLEFKSWKKVTSEAYDTSFGYRFIYRLRNYCQHIGMPPLAVGFSSNSKGHYAKFQIDFIKDELVKHKDVWPKIIKEDFNRMPDQIPLLPILEDWEKAYFKIKDTLLKIKAVKGEDAAKRILTMGSEFLDPNQKGQIAIAHVKTNINKSYDFTFKRIHRHKAEVLLNFIS